MLHFRLETVIFKNCFLGKKLLTEILLFGLEFENEIFLFRLDIEIEKLFFGLFETFN